MLIFGQDFLFFTSLSPETGQLVLDANSMAAIQPAWFYLAAPQAWTLSVELTFYLIAPFVIRRGLGTLMLLIAASLAVRAAVWLAALPLDPWCQRFTPAELCFFLLGVVCYHIYVRLKTSRPRPAVLKAITFPYLAFLLLYQFIPGEASFTKDYATYLMTVIACPSCFTTPSPSNGTAGSASCPIRSTSRTGWSSWSCAISSARAGCRPCPSSARWP
jgi:peptidoglycan/LPS O-acetylase OafA/YrhL